MRKFRNVYWLSFTWNRENWIHVGETGTGYTTLYSISIPPFAFHLLQIKVENMYDVEKIL